MAEATTETSEMAMKVFAVPELLENILLRLALRDLLFASTVCTTWRSTVAGSPSIQRALFYKPGTLVDVAEAEGDETSQAECHEDGYSLNPFLFDLESGSLQQAIAEPDALCRLSHVAPDSRRKMFLAQPPIKMLVWFGVSIWRSDASYLCEEDAVFMLERGSTFGQLVKDCRHSVSQLEMEGLELQPDGSLSFVSATGCTDLSVLQWRERIACGFQSRA
ncbi:hypothetical protein LTR53_005161 [Teratosphaeriaceae sp. CCFEE 6253]|nr:hypothetical protein LTR53_005161 [Teratosphaeriaceae sp. CCFEE 6253]